MEPCASKLTQLQMLDAVSSDDILFHLYSSKQQRITEDLAAYYSMSAATGIRSPCLEM